MRVVKIAYIALSNKPLRPSIKHFAPSVCARKGSQPLELLTLSREDFQKLGFGEQLKFARRESRWDEWLMIIIPIKWLELGVYPICRQTPCTTNSFVCVSEHLGENQPQI